MDRILLKSPCYDCLQKFEPVLANLRDIGATMTPCTPLVERLMTYDLMNTEALNCENVSQKARMKFFASALHADFLEARAMAWLSAARGMADPEERKECLKTVAAMECSNKEVKDSIAMAVAIFVLPTGEKEALQYLLAEQGRVQFAREWGGPEEYGVYEYFVSTETGPLAALSWESFNSAVEAIVRCNLAESVTNPIARGLVDFALGLLPLGSEECFWPLAAWQLGASARAAAPSWAENAPPLIVAALGNKQLTDLIKQVRNLLGDKDTPPVLGPRTKNLQTV